MQDTVPPPPSQQRPGKRRPLAWIIALLILIAIGAAVWVHLQGAHSSARRPQAQSVGVATAARGDMPEMLSALDRKSTRLNSSHLVISYAVFCLKKKNFAALRVSLPAPECAFYLP